MQVFSRSQPPAANPSRRMYKIAGFLGAILVLLAIGVPAFAQYGLPPSPAFAIGQRLQAEAEAANDYAQRLKVAGKPLDAADQRRIARIRANQAIHQYQIVTESATYRHTAVAAEATLFWARLDDQILGDREAAGSVYKQLLNNFALVSYPDKAVAEKEAQSVAAAIDHAHKTTFPSSIAYGVMDLLVNLTGRTSNSYWLAIVMISVFVKLITWPLSVKQFRSLKETQKLQPYIKELQAKYKNDRETLGRKTMELYQEHGINPMAGCAPMLIQLPIWYLLYNTIRIYEFQFQHGAFLWIGSYFSKLYPHIFATDLDQPDIPLLCLYMLSMYVQQRMVVPPDPQQAEQQRMMAIWTPFMSGFIFLQGHWPSGFLLYYLIFNLLSMLQQKLYMKSNSTEVAQPGPFDSVPSDTSAVSGDGKRNGRSSESAVASENRAFSNGAKPAAKGAISPKIHPKKKRR